ncbi:MAG: hypothetical protein JWR65_4985, partial [Massilia sp.]|nr:hypothetical protein [Massilia sp.]
STIKPKMESYKQLHKFRRTIMIRFPLTWTSLQLALAGASAYIVCTTDLLRGAAIFLH